MIEITGSKHGELIIRPANELSTSTYKEFFNVLTFIENNEKPHTITIDLANTNWVDSMGLGLLYNLYLRWRSSVHSFHIINATGNMIDTLKKGHIHRQYTIN